MSSDLYIFAGGGTGGHLYPGLAVAAELTDLSPTARIVFACSGREIDRRLLGPSPYAVVPQPVRPLPRGWRGVWPFLRDGGRSSIQARAMIADLRPAAVLGLGGFAAAPVVRSAARAGIRTALLNPDAVPGKANRMLANSADVIFTQFDRTAGAFPGRLGSRIRAVGCPVRPLAAGPQQRQEAMAYFALTPDCRTLLVLGGSMGAAAINDAVTCLYDRILALDPPWQVLHITGSGKGRPCASERQRSGGRVRTVEYCDRMALAYAAADLALCRAGASTVAELAISGTPAVFMPYPYHADRHQHLNAAAMCGAGAAVICEDAKAPRANAQALERVLLPILADAGRPAQMRESIAGLGKPDAARHVAEWLGGARPQSRPG